MVGHYERLSYLDNSFLALESRTTHMHVAGLAIFEAASLRTQGGGVDIDRIRRHIASKLHMIPRYRQRLAWVPIERHPVWVDDEHFHLEYHVRHTSLPRPGSFQQLKSLMARVVSQQLDRTKPLWELHVVEGLDEDRFALISKMHHSMIDGIAGVDLLAVLMSLVPDETIEPPEPYEPRPVPTATEFFVLEALRRAQRLAATARSLRGMVTDAEKLAFEGARRTRAVANSLASGWLSTATRTPLNGSVSPVRRFETLAIPLDEVKEVKNTLGGTVNDVVLATVAGAVRLFLRKDRGFDVERIDFRAMAPVSVRVGGDRDDSMGNQIAMWLVQMPIGEPDPIARFDSIRAATMRLKETEQALGAATLVRMSAGAPATLVSLASRLAASARPFNMTVTNVPGPQFPLYFLGSALVESYPLVPLWEGHGIGIALFSYNKTVYWGLNADYDVVADVDRLRDTIQESFDELLAAAREGRPTPPAGADGDDDTADRAGDSDTRSAREKA